MVSIINFYVLQNRPSKEGFDIVIGNPPYVEAKKLKYIASTLKEKFSVYSGTADLSIYFNELGLNILADKGIISSPPTNFSIQAMGKKYEDSFLLNVSTLFSTSSK